MEKIKKPSSNLNFFTNFSKNLINKLVILLNLREYNIETTCLNLKI